MPQSKTIVFIIYLVLFCCSFAETKQILPDADLTKQTCCNEKKESSYDFIARVGSSNSKKVEIAVSYAATQALSGICSSNVKVVLVFDNFELSASQRTSMLEQLADFFPKEIIFGCNGFGPISTETNDTNLVVLVLGGDINIQTSLFELEPDENTYSQAGKEMSYFVFDKIAKNSPEAHNLVILLGDMHVPDHDKIAAEFDI